MVDPDEPRLRHRRDQHNPRVKYVNLGNTGLRVSRVCLGMMSFGPHDERPWALGEDDAEPIVRRAAEGGVTSSTPRTSTTAARARC